MTILSNVQVRRLRDYVNERVEEQGCDHSHRFTREWVANEQADWDNVLDLLEYNGSFCDCEVVCNLADDGQLPPRPEPTANRKDWRLPPTWVPTPDAVFTKVIIGKPGIVRNAYSSAGELLVPPPAGTKPRKRVRASVHFFVGCESGLPSEAGVVATCDGYTSEQFAFQVHASGLEEFATFSHREAAFVLSRVAGLEPGTPVGTHFMETSGVVGKREELRVHKVVIRQ